MILKQAIGGVVAASTLLGMVGSVAASGFALIEQNGSGLGNAYAGGAAVAEDASTIFYNPAGMSRLSGRQFVVSGSMIKPSAKFTSSAGTPDGGDAGSWAMVPNAYIAMEVNPKWRVGLGINSPFGLQTKYDSAWVGKTQGIKSKIETINVNPSVSYQANEDISIGLGINYQHIKGELTSNPAATSISTLSGTDAAWGYNLGTLTNLSSQTRVGFAYRSAIKYNLSGQLDFTAPLTGFSTPVTLAIAMPESFSASLFHQLDAKWDLMTDATWTGWGTFNELRVVRPNGTSAQVVPENWRDTWRISGGSNFHYNDHWVARMGIAYDQTPVSDTYRTVRIPDGNRAWLSVGGQYKPGKNRALDFGYAHLFVGNASIEQPPVSGSYKNMVDILNVQYTQGF